MQAQSCAAAFDEDGRQAGAGGVVIGTTCSQRAYHIFHVQHTGNGARFLFNLGCGLAGIINIGMQAFMDIAAVHIYIKIGDREKVAADKIGSFICQRAQRVAGENAV